MSGRARCDEILRLIDEVIGSDVEEAKGERIASVLPASRRIP